VPKTNCHYAPKPQSKMCAFNRRVMRILSTKRNEATHWRHVPHHSTQGLGASSRWWRLTLPYPIHQLCPRILAYEKG